MNVPTVFQSQSAWPPHIELFGMEFPHATIGPNWYKATEPIYSLIIRACRIDRIEPGAFDIPTFHELNILSFSNCTPFEYKYGFFDGLRSITNFVIEDMHIRGIDEGFLVPIRRTVQFFGSDNYTDFLDFNVGFGTHKYLQLTELVFSGCPHVRRLAYSNFTGLSTLRELSLENNAIEVLEDRAFDYVLFSLKSINLSGNRLKTLPVRIFKVLLESCNDEENGPEILLADNPWSCGCEVIEAMHTLSIYRRNWTAYTALSDICPAADARRIRKDCPDLQVIDHRSIDSNTTSHAAHVKFSIKLDKFRKTLKFQTSNQRDVRLWVADHDTSMHATLRNPRCPKYDWLTAYTKCYQLPKGSIEMTVPRFIGPHLQFKTICVNYVAPNGLLTFWPLNCVTYRKFDPDNIDFWYLRTTLIAVCCCVFGCLTGLSIASFYQSVKKRRNSKNGTGKATNTRFDRDKSLWKNRRISHLQKNSCRNLYINESESTCIDSLEIQDYYVYNATHKDEHGYITFETNLDAEYEKVTPTAFRKVKRSSSEALTNL